MNTKKHYTPYGKVNQVEKRIVKKPKLKGSLRKDIDEGYRYFMAKRNRAVSKSDYAP